MNKKHYIYYTTIEDSRFQKSKILLSNNDFELIKSILDQYDLFHITQNYFEMFIWSYEDLNNIFNEYKTKINNVIKLKRLLVPDDFQLYGRAITLFINTEVIKFLRSTNTFLEYFDAYIKRYFPEDIYNKYKSITNDIYANNFEYRFCYHLRSYSVHYSPPIKYVIIDNNTKIEGNKYRLTKKILLNGGIDNQMKLIENDDLGDDIIVSLEFDINKFINGSFNWRDPICKEIETNQEQLNPINIFNKYSRLVSDMYIDSQLLLRKKIKEESNIIIKYKQKLKEDIGDFEQIYIGSILEDESGNIKEETYILIRGFDDD